MEIILHYSSGSALSKKLLVYTSKRSENLITEPVANQCINTVITGAEAPQLNLLPTHNLFRIAIAPLNRDIRIGIGIDKNVECTRFGEFRQESD